MLTRGLAIAAVVASLYLVFRIYLSGHPLLGSACLAAFAVAFYIYGTRRASTYRYLFPGLAGIGVFVVLPLLYTVWMGFTNYSSGNLLTFERATEALLGDTYRQEGQSFQFTLHQVEGGYRLVLSPQGNGEPAGQDPDADGAGTDGQEGGDEGDSIFGEDSIFDEEQPGGDEGGEGGGEEGEGGEGEEGEGEAAGDVEQGADSGDGETAAEAGESNAGTAGAGADEAGADEAGADEAGAEVAGAGEPQRFVTPVLPLTSNAPSTVEVMPLSEVSGFEPGEPLLIGEVVQRRDAIRALTMRLPNGNSAVMDTLRSFAPLAPLYRQNADLSLTNQKTGEQLTPDFELGFYVDAAGQPVEPGFRVNVGFDNYLRIFLDSKFRGPFFRIFLWTVTFAGLTVLFTLAVGMLLAEILAWEELRFRGVYQMLLFLPYAVPAFISILVFKGLFNTNFGEINVILNELFGIMPNWMGDALLAKVMILIVNTWLGYPYFMLLCMGLKKSIPKDLYEATALAGAGPLTNFFRITWPLIRRPLMPLLISSFAFNFNNFVLIFLLTGGRPDFLDTSVPAGETDILVSYTYRIAFEYAGQNLGLAAAISTIIFFLVAILSVINLRMTKVNEAERR